MPSPRAPRRFGATALAFLLATATVVALPLTSTAIPGVGFPATVVPIGLGGHNHPYRTIEADGSEGSAWWRVVHTASGNANENYITTTSGGRILNWGGTNLRYTDDGTSWFEVLPRVGLSGAEGAVVATPDGGAVGMTWSPWSGDRVVTMRYAPSTGWRTFETVMHSPFFDRPWLSVIPGPFEVAGQTVPYVTVMAGGWPVKPRFYSLDGLTYLAPSTESLAVPPSPLPTLAPDPSVEYSGTHMATRITPLPGGGALSTGQIGCRWALYQPDLRWSCATSPLQPEGEVLVDGAGRIHVFDVSTSFIQYSVSSDGGATFTSWFGGVPDSLGAFDYDLRVHGGLGLAAIAIHGQGIDRDQDVILKFSLASGSPVLERTYYLGAGDFDFSDALNLDGTPRFDFSSVAFLPDGKLVTSFADGDHRAALAIEL